MTFRGTKVPLWARFVILNVGMLISLGVANRLQSDWESIAAVVIAFIVINFAAWISSRHFSEWK
jgi:hypothetical protein